LAAKTFAKLKSPIYYVNGNHDSATAIQRHLSMGPRTILGDDDRLTYFFEICGFRFLVLDAKGPPEIDPNGLLPDSQLDLLARESQEVGPPLIIFIHFPILPMNSIWMDTNMLLLNGPTVHRLLYPARNRIRAVFSGHVHQHMQMVKDGILYASVASTFSQFGAWPEDIHTHHDLDQDPGYSFVHLLPDQTIIHQHTFPRPVAE
jgi:3',5'-cyclic AMP phosphodiesterase CpdA